MLEMGIPYEVERALVLLWDSEPVKAAYERKNEFYLLDSAKL
jgi:hypothetical protein